MISIGYLTVSTLLSFGKEEMLLDLSVDIFQNLQLKIYLDILFFFLQTHRYREQAEIAKEEGVGRWVKRKKKSFFLKSTQV